ncbi:Acyl-CoA-binding protein, partial [Hondaea fermentalgiana]
MAVTPEAFASAVEHVKQHASAKVGDADKLRLYGLYKQALEGDCKAPAPSVLSVVAHAKWKAWNESTGTSQEKARQLYLATVSELYPAFAVPKCAAELTLENPAEEPADEAKSSAPVEIPTEDLATETPLEPNAEKAVEVAAEAIELAATALKAATSKAATTSDDTARSASVPGAKVSSESKQQKSQQQSAPKPELVAEVVSAETKVTSSTTSTSASTKKTSRVETLLAGTKPVAGPSVPSASSAPVFDAGLVKPRSAAKAPMSTFQMSVLASLGVSAIGVCGFLVSTLSPTALTFLVLIAAGIMGIIGSFAVLLDSNGLIAMYPSILQRILLDKTLVEVILEGTILRRIRDFITEIYPLIYCKTEEDRIEVLANMSQKTRELMTTRGIVNLLPEWQQRITLSTIEDAELFDEKEVLAACSPAKSPSSARSRRGPLALPVELPPEALASSPSTSDADFFPSKNSSSDSPPLPLLLLHIVSSSLGATSTASRAAVDVGPCSADEAPAPISISISISISIPDLAARG